MWKFLVISYPSGFDLTSKFISNSNFISAPGAQETQKQKTDKYPLVDKSAIELENAGPSTLER